MDFGHSFSPLLEERSEFRLLHGEAVAIDMALTLALAKDLGALSERSRDRAVSMILACGLPISSDLLTEALCVESFRQTTAHRGGALNFVLPTSSGRAKFVKQAEEIPASCFRSALAWLKSFERLNCRRIPAFPAPINTAALQTRTP
jgi:3-dehydroquinate synthase